MHCPEIRERLPGLLYGESRGAAGSAAGLERAENKIVEDHLAGCPACQAVYVGLQQVAGILDKLPVPQVRVDVARIYQEARRLQQHRLKQWRRAALGLAGVAALLLLALGLKVEIRLDGPQLVVRWGTPAEVKRRPLAPPAPELADVKMSPAEVTKSDLKLVRDLVHALAAEVENGGRQQQEMLLSLQKQLDQIERQAEERWAATIRYVAATAPAENQEKEGAKP